MAQTQGGNESPTGLEHVLQKRTENAAAASGTLGGSSAVSHFFELFCGVKMAASARLSLVSRSSIGPATENASSRPAMHRMCSFGISHFFRTFCWFQLWLALCVWQLCSAFRSGTLVEKESSRPCAVCAVLLKPFLELIASSFCGVNGIKNDTEPVPCARMTQQMTQSMSPAQEYDTTNDTESMAPAQE